MVRLDETCLTYCTYIINLLYAIKIFMHDVVRHRDVRRYVRRRQTMKGTEHEYLIVDAPLHG